MNNYTKTIGLFTASILLASCSGQFGSGKLGSKDEARNARSNFLKGGKEIVVLDIPTDEEVERQVQSEKTFREWSCKYVRDDFSATHHVNPEYVHERREFVEQHCDEAPIGITKETLTKRKTVFTRSCNHEEETSQFVCKELKVRGDEITREDWDDLKPTYTYFRY